MDAAGRKPVPNPGLHSGEIMITEHALVILTEDIPASGFEAGDVGD